MKMRYHLKKLIRKFHRLTKLHKGFTLIEILVVVLIIGILAVTVVLAFDQGNYQMRQNDMARTKDLSEMATAIEAFKADHGHYPFINWSGGQHAADKLGYTTCQAGYGISSHYSSGEVDTVDFSPGTKIVYTTDTETPCDDLSLQLLGLAYLPNMPESEATEPNWEPLNGSNRYLDEISKDPLPIGTLVVDKDDPNANTDYDVTLTPAPTFRYFYNSFGDSDSEAFNTGDRFWLNAIVQNQKSGEIDDFSGTNPTNLYYYEVGSANWFRHPRTAFDNIIVGVPATLPPVAAFEGTPTEGSAPLTVTFTDQSTNNPTSWSWNFGDTQTSTDQNPSHQYTSAGTYTVALTATNDGGNNTKTQSGYITVIAAAPNYSGSACSTQVDHDGNVNATEANNCCSVGPWTVASPAVTGDDHRGVVNGTDRGGKDPRTTLVWSQYLKNTTGNSSGSIVFTPNTDGSTFTYDTSGGNNTGRTADQLCTDRGNGWRLPTQKEFMQAYVDCAYWNMSNPLLNTDFFWTLTASSSTNWTQNLNMGSTYNVDQKNIPKYVRCVRGASMYSDQVVDDGNGAATPTNNGILTWTNNTSPITGDDSRSGGGNQDPRTGLTWSKNLLWNGTSVVFSDANGSVWSQDDKGANNVSAGRKTAAQLCPIAGAGWRLPTQKEMWQAYIDGAGWKLSNSTSTYWTSTAANSGGWYMYPTSIGKGLAGATSVTNNIRCVRP